jgi:SAM-dependent methyltransferase
MNLQDWSTVFDVDSSRAILGAAPALRLAQAEALLALAPPRQPVFVYEQCTGLGDLALAFSAAGARVWATDVNLSYLAAARAGARDRGLVCHFEVADARHYQPPEPADLVVNWRSSIGYGTAFDDRLILSAAAASLAPGGVFVLETTNPAHLARQGVDETPDPRVPGLSSLVRSERDGLVRVWRRRDVTGRLVGEATLRIHRVETLTEMMRLSGLGTPTLLGDATGRPFDPEGPRCLLLCRP